MPTDTYMNLEYAKSPILAFSPGDSKKNLGLQEYHLKATGHTPTWYGWKGPQIEWEGVIATRRWIESSLNQGKP